MMEPHNLLLRQLKKAGISDKNFPKNLDQWQKFLENISNTYKENDQERYLLGRSIEISSKEMMDLYENFEQAQRTAKIGIWNYDKDLDIFSWTKEISEITGVDTNRTPLSMKQFLEMVERDRERILELLDLAMRDGKVYELETFIRDIKGKGHWFYISGKAKDFGHTDKPIRYLSGIAMDITTRKIHEKKIETLHKQLLEAARQAGMSEVASSVLHNVGNILNSVKISLDLMEEIYKNSHIKKLTLVAGLLNKHSENLDKFLIEDEKGKLIPPYIIELEKVTQKEHLNLGKELENLSNNIRHISEIINTQQEISGISVLSEELDINQVIREALKIAGAPFINIEIIVKCDVLKPMKVQKSKILLILINLIKNAKESIIQAQRQKGHIKIFVTHQENNKVMITIEDDGVGIDRNNLIKIFSYGFSTKKNGHGFGLNSSALTAKLLKGSLTSSSKGVGKGAKFTLLLPLS